MKTAVTRRYLCEVSEDVPRVDLVVGKTEFVGAALHGSGGIAADPHRALRGRRARGERLLVHTYYHADGDDALEVSSRAARIIAVYPARR